MKKAKHEDRVLVTGAGGFVGQHVVKEALAQGFPVRASDLAGPDLSWAEKLGAEVVRGDLTDRDQVKAMVRGVGLVAHIAAAYDLGMARTELLRINRDGSRILAEEAASAGVRHFVHCSTADTYGIQPQKPIKEYCRQEPENDYAFSKLAAEQAVTETGADRGMPVTVLRPTLIYGPGAVYTASLFYPLPFILHGFLGRVPSLKGGPQLNAVHIQDMAGSTVFALPRLEMAGEAYNVADDHWQTVGEFFGNIVEPLGLPGSPFTIPLSPGLMGWSTKILMQLPPAALLPVSRFLQAEWSRVVRHHGLVHALNPRLDKGFLSYGSGDHVFDNSKIKAAGYQLRWPDFATGWRETTRWYQAQKWIP